MKWPWISRRFYEYEKRFWDDMAAHDHASYARVMAQNKEFLDMYIEIVKERDHLRAQANSLLGRLLATGDPVAKEYGPFIAAPRILQ